MKAKFLIALLIPMVAFLVACENETTGGVSKITTFPTISVTGDLFMSQVEGGTFADPGAVGKEGPKDAQVLVTFSKFSNGEITSVSGVDASKPGLFRVNYTAVNVDGFKVEAYRWVGIISKANETRDFSGSYRRTNGTLVTITKKGIGMYSIDNVGGVPNNPPYVFPFVFYNLEGDVLEGPTQPGVSGNPTYFKDGKVNSAGTQVSWAVMGAGFGTATRTFNKQ
jgi:hypothetical protein